MTLATLLSAGLLGIDAFPIHVEVNLSFGMPGWATVGLAESAVKESKERVLSAISNCGYQIPLHRITLNLAPADIKKSGTALDLPTAIGLLAASELIPKERLKGYLLLGELSLTGRLRAIRGVLSVAVLAKEMGLKGLILPQNNVWEARPIEGLKVLGAPDLSAVVEFFLGNNPLNQFSAPPPERMTPVEAQPDFSEVKGQAQAKRAIEVAAGGFHNVLMVGSHTR